MVFETRLHKRRGKCRIGHEFCVKVYTFMIKHKLKSIIFFFVINTMNEGYCGKYRKHSYFFILLG